MKRSLAILPLFLCLLAPGRADPGADLEAAIQALLAQPNFSWRVTFVRSDDGRAYAYDGKTERGGFTVVTTGSLGLPSLGLANSEIMFQHIGGDRSVNATEGPIAIVYHGERGVAKLDDGWLTPREVFTALTGRSTRIMDALQGASGRGGVLARLPGTRTTVWREEGTIAVPRPDLILSLLRGELENAKSAGRAIAAEVAGRAVVRLFDSSLAVPGVDTGGGMVEITGPVRRTSTKNGRTSVQVLPAPETSSAPSIPKIVTYHGGSGDGTFWLVAGELAKFELRLEATELIRGAAQGERRAIVITATLNDFGATDVVVPEGARERLER